MISGFMIIKDVLKQGYPFVEAIASALPICDEFLISEGYSIDGTYETIEKIAQLNRKVKVYRQRWPIAKSSTFLADITNEVRKKCRFDYIFYVQANEVMHEESAAFVKALPEMRPDVNTFSFPYIQFMGIEKYTEDFRLRFSKNLPEIEAVSDAWTLGLSRKSLLRELSKSIKTPRRLLTYIGRGIDWTYADACGSPLCKPIYLPRPVFRYWSLFPRNHVEKCAGHAEVFNLPDWKKTVAALEKKVDEPNFWEKVVKNARATPYGVKYPDALAAIKKENHPRLMQGLIANTSIKRYFVREEILESVKDL